MSVMHEKATCVCFINMQPQKLKFKVVQINMKQVSYDLWPTYSFLLAPLKMVALTTSRVYLMIYLIDITHVDKICDYVGQKF